MLCSALPEYVYVDDGKKNSDQHRREREKRKRRNKFKLPNRMMLQKGNVTDQIEGN